MPQLDRFAFVSQVIWLIIVFVSLYFVILRTGLPRLYKVLLYRDKKLETLKEGVAGLSEEEGELNNKTRGLVLGFVRELKGLPEQVGKVLDNELEDRKNNLKEKFEGIKSEESKETKDRVAKIDELLESTNFVKDKIDLKKRIIN